MRGRVDGLIKRNDLKLDQITKVTHLTGAGQAEAKAAAPDFGCTGAHQMGEMWMVCDKHGDAGHHGAH